MTMTAADQTHDAPTGSPWQETRADLQRDVSRLVDATTEAQRAYRAATERADAAAMLVARRRYLEASAALAEVRVALAVADASLRLEQMQERLAAWEEQQRAPGPPGGLAPRVRTWGEQRAHQSLVEAVREARAGVDEAIARAMQRLR